MPATQSPDVNRTLIGVLACHESKDKNERLVEVFDETEAQMLKEFHFVFTGGTYDRVLYGDEDLGVKKMKLGRRKVVSSGSTRLPSYDRGGVVLLANLIVQRQISILWVFLDPTRAHWVSNDNVALMRLCDIWNVKRLMNHGSVKRWFEYEAEQDQLRSCQPMPLRMPLPTVDNGIAMEPNNKRGGFDFNVRSHSIEDKKILALIAHDEMKGRMIDFVVEYEKELDQFDKILATGTTAREVEDASRRLKENKKVIYCLSGPKGGDIEIATEILLGRCHVVIFFVDPLRPHPHIEDVRTVFGACMIQDKAQILSNQVQAREWMECVRKRGLANMKI